jgi:hypothetical protein
MDVQAQIHSPHIRRYHPECIDEALSLPILRSRDLIPSLIPFEASSGQQINESPAYASRVLSHMDCEREGSHEIAWKGAK